MRLKYGKYAHTWHPDIDVLSRLKVKWPRESDFEDKDSILFSNTHPRQSISKKSVLVDYDAELDSRGQTANSNNDVPHLAKNNGHPSAEVLMFNL